MKITASLLSMSAVAVALLLAPPAFAVEEDLSEAEAQSYARDLLEPEEERDGLKNIYEEREDERIEEKNGNDLGDDYEDDLSTED
jgi:hypothetical protein